MKKSEQSAINDLCTIEYKKALKEFSTGDIKYKRLRSCSALVYTTNNYYILKSYNTIVAVINRNTDTLYDVLRIVYGYTHTSAQHIAKFDHDYCDINEWSCRARYTAR